MGLDGKAGGGSIFPSNLTNPLIILKPDTSHHHDPHDDLDDLDDHDHHDDLDDHDDFILQRRQEGLLHHLLLAGLPLQPRRAGLRRRASTFNFEQKYQKSREK